MHVCCGCLSKCSFRSVINLEIGWIIQTPQSTTIKMNKITFYTITRGHTSLILRPHPKDRDEAPSKRSRWGLGTRQRPYSSLWLESYPGSSLHYHTLPYTFMSTQSSNTYCYVSCVYAHMKQVAMPFNNTPSQVGVLPDHSPVA